MSSSLSFSWAMHWTKLYQYWLLLYFYFVHIKEQWLDFKFETSVLAITSSKPLHTGVEKQAFRILFLEHDVIIQEAVVSYGLDMLKCSFKSFLCWKHDPQREGMGPLGEGRVGGPELNEGCVLKRDSGIPMSLPQVLWSFWWSFTTCHEALVRVLPILTSCIF